MLRGQPAVFLSCSEKFKESLAWPVRDALAAEGLRTVIASDEPGLPGTGRDPDAHIEAYLDACAAFVALCTPDYGLSDGTMYPRASIIDEIQRASARPHLRDHSQVLRSPGVLLPSSVEATFDQLDAASPVGTAEVILARLRQWEDLTRPPGRPPGAAPSVNGSSGAAAAFAGAAFAGAADADLTALLGGPPPDHEQAPLLAYELLRDRDEPGRRRLTAALHGEVTGHGEAAGDGARRLTAAALLEAVARLDPPLVPAAMIESLAARPDYLPRACAANLLRDRAVATPAEVPLELLGRLARPAAEDWLVWAPALAAAKELALSRRDAFVIFESLSASPAARDRHAVARAMADIAAVEPAAVVPEVTERLAGDGDPLIAEKAREVMAVIGQVSDADRAQRYGHFAL